MATQKNDKQLVSILIIACSLIICGVHLAYADWLAESFSSGWFSVTEAVLLAIYIWGAYGAYKDSLYLDDNAALQEWKRWVVVVVMFAFIGLVAGYGSYLKDLIR